MNLTKWKVFVTLMCMAHCAPIIYVEGEQKDLNEFGENITKVGQLQLAIEKLYAEEVAAGKELIVYVKALYKEDIETCKTPAVGFLDYHNLSNYSSCVMHFSFLSRPFWRVLNGTVTAFLTTGNFLYKPRTKNSGLIYSQLKKVALSESKSSRPFDLVAYGSPDPSGETPLAQLHGWYFVIVDRPCLMIGRDLVHFFLEGEEHMNIAGLPEGAKLSILKSEDMETISVGQIPYKLHYVGPGSPKEETPLKQLIGQYFSIQRFPFDSVEVVDWNGFFPQISFKLSFVDRKCKLQHFLELSTDVEGLIGGETFNLGKRDLIQSQGIFIPETNENYFFIVKVFNDSSSWEDVLFSPSEIREEQKISKELNGEQVYAPIVVCKDGFIQSFLFEEGEYYINMVSFYTRDGNSIGNLDLNEFPAKDIILALMFQSSYDFFDIIGSKEDRISSLVPAFLFADFYGWKTAKTRISNALEEFIVEPRLFSVYALLLIRENAINLISDSLHLVPIQDLWLNLFDIKFMKQDFIYEYVEFLIEQEINVNYPNRNNETLLRFAGLADNNQVVQLLLANGAHLDSYPLKLKYKLLKSSQ